MRAGLSLLRGKGGVVGGGYRQNLGWSNEVYWRRERLLRGWRLRGWWALGYIGGFSQLIRWTGNESPKKLRMSGGWRF